MCKADSSEILSSFEVVLPPSILDTCQRLRPGISTCFLAVNKQEGTSSQITVAKQNDKSVVLRVAGKYLDYFMLMRRFVALLLKSGKLPFEKEVGILIKRLCTLIYCPPGEGDGLLPETTSILAAVWGTWDASPCSRGFKTGPNLPKGHCIYQLYTVTWQSFDERWKALKIFWFYLRYMLYIVAGNACFILSNYLLW